MPPTPANYDASPPAPLDGVVTRASTNPRSDTAQPSRTSGFGAVIEKELDLQNATASALGHAHGIRSSDTDRILRHQQAQLTANIALLGQRYQLLPHPERFADWHPRLDDTAPQSDSVIISDLVERHTTLLADIEALIDCDPDGQRGELILREVGRNHDDMAWMLSALLKEDQTAAATPDVENSAPSALAPEPNDNWDNDGGASGHPR